MKEFPAKLPSSPGRLGHGRELVRLLVAEGCHVAMCDVSPRGLAETLRLRTAAGLPQGVRITSHVADVSKEADVLSFLNRPRRSMRPIASTCSSITQASAAAEA